MIKDLELNEAKELIKENRENPDFDILDIQPKEHFEEARIQNCIHIDMFRGKEYEKISELDQSKSYLVYCRTGLKSHIGIQYMEKLGFNKLYHLYEGLGEWMKKDYPVEK